jgi:hypothetical protein
MAEATEPLSVEGRCLCGQVRYRLEGDSFGILYCHCQRCRKHSGAAFVGFLMLRSGRLRWRSGRGVLGEFATEATRRAFCRHCGSSMPTPGDDDTRLMNVFAGNMLDMRPPRAHGHVYTGSRCPWVVIPDDVPQWETVAPEFRDQDPRLDVLDRHREAHRLTGSCLCGAVRFALSSVLGMRNCHCSRCRLSRAAAYATNLFAAADDFEWQSGEDRIERFHLPGAQRFGSAFCRDCGSLVPRRFTDRLNIPAGCLDADPGIAPAGHIFTGSKAPWYRIEDDLPQYAVRMTDQG